MQVVLEHALCGQQLFTMPPGQALRPGHAPPLLGPPQLFPSGPGPASQPNGNNAGQGGQGQQGQSTGQGGGPGQGQGGRRQGPPLEPGVQAPIMVLVKDFVLLVCDALESLGLPAAPLEVSTAQGDAHSMLNGQQV